jgi:hypothetical protein
MSFLFEVKFKNGKVQQIRIKADIAAEAIKMLKSSYGEISSYKFLN